MSSRFHKQLLKQREDANTEIQSRPTSSQAMLMEQSPPAFNQVASLTPGGWLMIDDRNSGGEMVECDTFQCCHCQSIVMMNPGRVRPRNRCRKCMKTTCDQAPCVLECDHWEKKWENDRPWLLPHQIPDAQAHEWFGPEQIAKTPAVWLPRAVGGIYGYRPM